MRPWFGESYYRSNFLLSGPAPRLQSPPLATASPAMTKLQPGQGGAGGAAAAAATNTADQIAGVA